MPTEATALECFALDANEVARAAGLGEQVTPPVLWHVAGTWQMQAGVDIWEAGGYLGMTAGTLEDTYGHHRPDHLRGASDAYIRHHQRLTNATREPKTNRKARSLAGNHEMARK